MAVGNETNYSKNYPFTLTFDFKTHLRVMGRERERLQNGPEINEKGSTSINAERGREKEWVTDYTTPSWDTLNTWERQRERVRSLFCSYKIWNEAQTWGWTEELLTQFDPSTETNSEALARKSKFLSSFCQNENFSPKRPDLGLG